MKRMWIACCSALLVAVPAAAFQPPGQNAFVPAAPLSAAEQLPAAPLLVAAYAFVWVALLVYVWSIWRRLGKVEQEMRTLERRARRSAP
jgi:CcmD family protein